MRLKTAQGIAAAIIKPFESGETKICRAPEGLSLNSTPPASIKLTVATAMLALDFLVSVLFKDNRTLRI